MLNLTLGGNTVVASSDFSSFDVPFDTPITDPIGLRAYQEFRRLKAYADAKPEDEWGSYLSDLHKSHRLSIPPLTRIVPFDVPKEFHAWDLIYSLRRKEEFSFNGTIHPRVVAKILEEQMASGSGPLVTTLQKGSDHWPYNTFFWGSLFMLTLHQMGNGQWNVQTCAAIQYPNDHPTPDELAPTNAKWIRQGRLFLAL